MQQKIRNAFQFDWRSFLESPNLLPNSVRFFLLIIPPAIGFFQDFVQLFYLALSNQEVQYVLLVPFFIVYFLYKKRRAFSIPREASFFHDVIGACLCLLAISTYVWGSYSVYPLQMHLLALPILLAGITLLLYGPKVLRILIFPIAVLVFLSPLPLVFLDSYGGALIQSVANSVALVVRPFLSIQVSLSPVVTLTTVTTTGEKIQFSLSAACSGVYSLTSFAFLAVVLGYIATGSPAKKTIFAGLSLLAAYVLNMFRIVTMVVLGHFFGYGLAVDSFHLLGGVALIFIGTVMLLFAGDKLLKLSFIQKEPPNYCATCKKSKSICNSCGRIIKFPKTGINWKRLSLILIFLMLCTNLVLQASAANYNVVSSNAQTAVDFNPTTGELATFSNLTSYNAIFAGRESDAEATLNLQFVGDYSLIGNNNSKTVDAIFEVSDIQSKFHTWEGCLHYQSYPINIEKTYVTILYDQNNDFVYGEMFITDAPTLHMNLILLYWFDTVNLRTNGTANAWSVKVTLLDYIDNTNNQTTTEQVENATTELLSLGQQLEATWSQDKNPQTGFAVDIYKNNEAFTMAVTALLVISAVMLSVSYLLKKTGARKKTSELSETDKILLGNLKHQKASMPKENQPNTNYSTDKMKELCKQGILREKISVNDDELYIKWVPY